MTEEKDNTPVETPETDKGSVLDGPEQEPDKDKIVAPTITFRALALGLVLSGFFTWFGLVYHRNLAGTQIPVIPYLLLFVFLLMLNPLLRATRVIRLLTTAEVMTIFLMCFLSSMVAGKSNQLIYLISTISHRHYNAHSAEYDVYIEPFQRDFMMVVEKGRQKRAKEMRRIVMERKSCKSALDSAKRLKLQREHLAKAKEELARDMPTDAKEAKHRQKQIDRLQAFHDFAQERWDEEEAKGHDFDTALTDYEAKIETLKEEEKVLAERMAELKEDVYKEMDLFHRGLPDKLRAVPGIIYTPGEGWTAYYSRIARVTHGRRALKIIKKAERLLEDGRAPPPEVNTHLLAALEELDQISDGTEVHERQDKLEDDIKAAREELGAAKAELADVKQKRRFVKPDEFEKYDELIRVGEKKVEAKKKALAKLEKTLDKVVRPQTVAVDQVNLVREKLAAIQQSLGGADAPASAELLSQLQTLRPEFVYFDASLRRFLISDINWKIWVKPVASWVFVFAVLYVMLMTLNSLVYRQWAYNEKLVYPLAHLPEIIAEGGDDRKQWVPTICKSGLFWVGVATSFGILTWNYLAKNHIIAGISPIKLIVQLSPYFENSIFHGIRQIRFFILFTVIGVAFLLPTRITFSLWGFYVFYLVQGLILNWIGPRPPWFMKKCANAQGAGAMLVFAAFTFYASKNYFLAAFRPSVLGALEEEERKAIRYGSALFLGSTLLFFFICVFMFGVHPIYAFVFIFIWLTIAMTFTRVVAEGGLPSMACNFSPFDLVRFTVTMKHSWSAPAMTSPLFYMNMLMFPLLAPMMANAIRLRDRMKLNRKWFHIGILAAIAIAIAVGVATKLILIYDGNVGEHINSGTYWTYLLQYKNFMKSGSNLEMASKWWMLSGAAMMIFILVTRKRWPWMVHPIGLLLLASGTILGYWGSIIIGWGCKVLVSTYGSRKAYERLRYLFIGLVIGELVAAIFGFHNFVHPNWGR